MGQDEALQYSPEAVKDFDPNAVITIEAAFSEEVKPFTHLQPADWARLATVETAKEADEEVNFRPEITKTVRIQHSDDSGRSSTLEFSLTPMTDALMRQVWAGLVAKRNNRPPTVPYDLQLNFSAGPDKQWSMDNPVCAMMVHVSSVSPHFLNLEGLDTSDYLNEAPIEGLSYLLTMGNTPINLKPFSAAECFYDRQDHITSAKPYTGNDGTSITDQKGKDTSEYFLLPIDSRLLDVGVTAHITGNESVESR